MKIEHLIIRNINSLYGQWSIDFTSPEFIGGIFVISGKTGSGKSSILDAISLALFGETPRLNRGNKMEIISRGAPDCLAELTFCTGGDRYVASFSFITKVGKRGTNRGVTSIESKHTLAKNGEVIFSNTTGVQKEVERVTGLDKERFCRTVLLAQGQFDAFLKSGTGKSAILEQITGTEIYTKIAAAVHTRHTGYKTKREHITASCSGILPMAAEEEEQKRATLEEIRKQTLSLPDELKKLNTLLGLFTEIRRLNSELTANRTAQAQLKLKLEDFSTERSRLALAKKAEPGRNLHLAVKDHTALKTQVLNKLESVDAQLPILRRKKDDAAQLAKKEEQTLSAAQTEAVKTRQLLQQVRTLDQEIVHLKQRVATELNRQDQLSSEIKSADKQRTQIAERLLSLAQDHTAAEQYIHDHANDETLIAKRGSWQEKLANLLTLKEYADRLSKDVSARTDAIKRTENIRSSAEIREAEQQKQLELYQSRRDELSASVKAILPEETLREQQSLLQENLILAQKVRDLESERTKLTDGTPCPLCGATHHPFATDAQSLPQDQAIRQKLDAVGKIIEERRTLSQRLLLTEKDLAQAGDLLAQATAQKRSAAETLLLQQTELKDTEATHHKAVTDFYQGKEELNNDFTANGIVWNGMRDLPPEVDQRIAGFKKAQEKLAQFQQQKSQLEADQRIVNASMAQKLKENEQLNTSIIEVANELEKLENTRTELFGSTLPDDTEKALDRQLKLLEETARTTSQNAAQAAATLSAEEKQRTALEQELVRHSEALNAATETFETFCRKQDFTIETFCNALTEPEYFAALVERETQLDSRAQTLQSQEQSLQNKLTETQSQIPADAQAEQLQSQQEELTAQLAEAQKRFGQLENELNRNEADKQRLADIQQELDDLNREAKVWEELHDLIGQSTHFQQAAQGITLDHLLYLANRELVKLFPRYELLRSEKETLGIDVIDHHQGDTVRPCDNLSGGECFIVSLALALGLSHMAGEKIRIDSLFLDEGFGTLDSDSLQFIVHVLARLHNDGKMVGIISHVAALTEEIHCVLHVTPVGGGKSVLSGPGVSRSDNS